MSIFPNDPLPVPEVQPEDPLIVGDQTFNVPDVARGVLDPNTVMVVLAEGYQPDPASPPIDLIGP